MHADDDVGVAFDFGRPALARHSSQARLTSNSGAYLLFHGHVLVHIRELLA